MEKESISGKVYSINQSFENDSKSITIHVKLDNRDGVKLLPGMYVSALINIGNQLVKAVPVNAVAHAEGKQFIFLFTGTEEGMILIAKKNVMMKVKFSSSKKWK